MSAKLADDQGPRRSDFIRARGHKAPRQQAGQMTPLADEVAGWVEKRSACHVIADWRFTTGDARVKLKSLYPQHE